MHIRTIARQDIKLLAREKTVLLLFSIFILLALASTFIGFFAQSNIQRVFSVAAAELQHEGKPVPPSPFSGLPDLSVVKNMIIYIVLCGALLAIVLGYSSGMHDKKAGSVKILFSHPITKMDFFFGKVLALAFVLAAAMLISFVISTESAGMLSHVTSADILRLMGFYALSFVYLLGFAILGFSFALIIDNNAIALVIPLIIWTVITFVIPEFASALYPTASLNPILPQNVTHSPTLDFMHSVASPFSISEHYKDSGAYILNLKDSFTTLISSGANASNVLLIISWLLICLLIGYIAVKKFNIAGGNNE